MSLQTSSGIKLNNRKVLYQNDNPTTIESLELTLGNYEVIEVTLRNSLDSDGYTVITIPKSINFKAIGIVWKNNKDLLAVRNCFFDGNNFYCWSCSGYGIGNYTGFEQNINDCLVPIKIVAYS